MTSPKQPIDILLDSLRDKLQDQPLYKKYSNTTTTIATLGVNVIWVLVGLGVDVPTDVTFGIAAAIQALGVVGIKFTPNGVTDKQVKEIERLGRHAKVEPPNQGE